MARIMRAQIKPGGKIFEGKLAETFIKKGIAKEIIDEGLEVKKVEAKEPLEKKEVKKVNAPKKKGRKPKKIN